MAVSDQPVSSRACVRCHGELLAPASFCPHCGASQRDPVPAGPIVAGYTIVRRLGSGGAADVYLARQDDLDREVAIKALRRDVDDPKQWRRFQREAQTVARLSSHPHVVTVHTAGRAETGQPYLVTEYLDRGSLADVVAAEGPLTPVGAAQVGVALAEALIAAHELGILHRDVKPANVLLGQDGRIKLGDFGIARLLEAQASTITDVMAFTPEHVAPEVLRNEPDGAWSDVYGLASTVASAVLGQPLFRMGPEERLDAFLARKVSSPPPTLPGWMSPALARPIAAGLDPDPARRPTLPELRDDLAAAVAELSVAPSTAPPTAVFPVTPEVPAERRRPPAETGEPGLRPPLPPNVGPRAPVGPERRTGPRRGLAIAVVLAVVALGLAAAGLLSGRPEGADPSDSAATPTNAPTAPTSAAPVVTPPVSEPATTSTTNPPAASAPVPLTPSEAETYLRSYYDAVAAGDYERTWAQLAPEFQTGTARSFDYYAGFWEDNDLEVGDVELVQADAEGAVVNAELRWNGSADAVVSQFTLRRREDGAFLIADQETVGG